MKPVNLLWTSGWDSSFRLLQLLLTYKQPVVPHYLIDAERGSVGMELRTIKRLKERLLADFPEVKELLQPTRYYAVADILPHPEITAAFHAIQSEFHFGNQYEWIARYCAQQGITEMEMAAFYITRHDAQRNKRLGSYMIEKTSVGGSTNYQIDPTHKGAPMHTLFSYFNFPVCKITKLDMGRIAQAEGWAHLLELTWFCHRPSRDGKPCGMCLPCSFVVEDGLARRIPPVRRELGKVYRAAIVPVRGHLKRLMGRG